jgi:hypothetical protein
MVELSIHPICLRPLPEKRSQNLCIACRCGTMLLTVCCLRIISGGNPDSSSLFDRASVMPAPEASSLKSAMSNVENSVSLAPARSAVAQPRGVPGEAERWAWLPWHT